MPAEFAWATLFSSMFLHGGWLHIIGNMWYLWIFGDNVEDRLGHGALPASSTCCAARRPALAQTLVNPDSTVPTIGASGAIAGVMGAYFVLYPHSRVLTLIPLFIFIEIIEIPAIFFLGIWFLMQLLSGVGSIAHTTGTAERRHRVLGARRRLRRRARPACSSSGGPRGSGWSGGANGRTNADRTRKKEELRRKKYSTSRLAHPPCLALLTSYFSLLTSYFSDFFPLTSYFLLVE